MNPIRVLCARRAQYLALTFVSAAALTACGGGGGDKDTPAQASSLQRFVINEGNYKDVISTSGAATMQATQPSGTASLVGVQARTGNWMSWVQAVIDQVRATPAVERSLVGVNSRSLVLQVRVRWSIPMPTRTTRSMAAMCSKPTSVLARRKMVRASTTASLS